MTEQELFFAKLNGTLIVCEDSMLDNDNIRWPDGFADSIDIANFSFDKDIILYNFSTKKEICFKKDYPVPIELFDIFRWIISEEETDSELLNKSSLKYYFI